MNRRIGSLFVAATLAVAGGWFLLKPTGPGGEMTAKAEGFIASLTPEQTAVAVMKYDDPARLDWHFIPKDKRKGLQIRDMTEPQRKAAHALLASALSQIGYGKATGIMELDAVLRELQKGKTGPLRDPERYYFTLFGQPRPEGKWGLSVEGHHLSLNFVVSAGEVVSSTPSFFGANPADIKSEVGVGPKVGTRILRDEEQFAFDLLHSLTAEQRKNAVIAEKAPMDIRAAGEPQPPSAAPEGLAAANLTGEQTKTLWSLLEAYANNMPKEVADQRLALAKQAGVEKAFFAWAGADKPGIGHYYRVQGPTFLIEFVNTQPDSAGNPANHIHSVWRDMAGDFGLARK